MASDPPDAVRYGAETVTYGEGDTATTLFG